MVLLLQPVQKSGWKLYFSTFSASAAMATDFECDAWMEVWFILAKEWDGQLLSSWASCQTMSDGTTLLVSITFWAAHSAHLLLTFWCSQIWPPPQARDTRSSPSHACRCCRCRNRHTRSSPSDARRFGRRRKRHIRSCACCARRGREGAVVAARVPPRRRKQTIQHQTWTVCADIGMIQACKTGDDTGMQDLVGRQASLRRLHPRRRRGFRWRVRCARTTPYVYIEPWIFHSKLCKPTWGTRVHIPRCLIVVACNGAIWYITGLRFHFTSAFISFFFDTCVCVCIQITIKTKTPLVFISVTGFKITNTFEGPGTWYNKGTEASRSLLRSPSSHRSLRHTHNVYSNS